MSTLAQGVIPMPGVHRRQHGGMTKFAIANQADLNPRRDQGSDITQQRHLFMHRAVTTTGPDPRPGQRQHPPSVSDAHHEQPMMRADFGCIQYQMDCSGHACRDHDLTRDGLIPLPHLHRPIAQKSFQSPYQTHLFHPVGNIGGDTTGLHAPRPTSPSASTPYSPVGYLLHPATIALGASTTYHRGVERAVVA